MDIQVAAPTGASPWRRRWWWPIAALAILMVLGVVAFAVFKPVKVLPRIRLAPGFVLTDQDGRRLTNEDLRGQVALYSFLYTGCGAACDSMNATLQEVQARLQDADLDGLPVQLVSVSFDPTRDTPERLRAYGASLGADPARWRFATGDADRLKQVIGNGFEAFYAPDGQGGFAFDPTFVLVDGWGIIRGEYHYQVETPDADRIMRHIGVLAEEVRKSIGANKLIYEAAHLFLCYSP